MAVFDTIKQGFFNALRQTIDRILFGLLHFLQIHSNIVGQNAVRFKFVAGLFVQVGTVQQSLGGNATDVQASAAQRPTTFHTNGLEAQLCRFDGTDVATGTPTNDTHVVVGGVDGLRRGKRGPERGSGGGSSVNSGQHYWRSILVRGIWFGG